MVHLMCLCPVRHFPLSACHRLWLAGAPCRAATTMKGSWNSRTRAAARVESNRSKPISPRTATTATSRKRAGSAARQRPRPDDHETSARAASPSVRYERNAAAAPVRERCAWQRGARTHAHARTHTSLTTTAPRALALLCSRGFSDEAHRRAAMAAAASLPQQQYPRRGAAESVEEHFGMDALREADDGGGEAEQDAQEHLTVRSHRRLPVPMLTHANVRRNAVLGVAGAAGARQAPRRAGASVQVATCCARRRSQRADGSRSERPCTSRMPRQAWRRTRRPARQRMACRGMAHRRRACPAPRGLAMRSRTRAPSSPRCACATSDACLPWLLPTPCTCGTPAGSARGSGVRGRQRAARQPHAEHVQHHLPGWRDTAPACAVWCAVSRGARHTAARCGLVGGGWQGRGVSHVGGTRDQGIPRPPAAPPAAQPAGRARLGGWGVRGMDRALPRRTGRASRAGPLRAVGSSGRGQPAPRVGLAGGAARGAASAEAAGVPAVPLPLLAAHAPPPPHAAVAHASVRGSELRHQMEEQRRRKVRPLPAHALAPLTARCCEGA